MTRKFRSDDTDKWLWGFGDGSDGDLTINSNVTEAPIDSSCSGTAGQKTLAATNASFAAGQIVMIHKSRGSTTVAVGEYEFNKIESYVAGTITFVHALQNSYNDSGADQSQVRVMKQYNNVTINNGITYTAKAWDKNVGGILGFFAKGTVTITGSISASGKGYVGGSGSASQGQAQAGEGSVGDVVAQRTANGNAGGGASGDDAQGGGGGHGTAGANGYTGHGNYGYGGNAVGVASLTTLFFGGASGAGANYDSSPAGLSGVPGGGIIAIFGSQIVITGSIVSTGTSGTNSSEGNGSAAGGSVLLKCKTATLGTNLITALGGPAIYGWNNAGTGAAGGVGRIHLDYKVSYSGTTNPTMDIAQDNTIDYISGGGAMYYEHFL